MRTYYFLPFCLGTIMALLSCRSSPSLTREVSPIQNNRDWCRLVGKTFGDFTCSRLPGEQALGQFRTSTSYDKNLVMCTPNHGLDELGFAFRPAQVSRYSEDWDSHYSGTNGLDLSEALSWLPSAKITSKSKQTIKIDVVVEKAIIRSISNLAMNFDNHRRTAPKAIEACARFLCDGDSSIIYEVLMGEPIVTLSARDKFDIETNIGWRKVLGLNNDGGYDGGYSIQLVRNPTENDERRMVVLAYKLTSAKKDLETLGLCKNPH